MRVIVSLMKGRKELSRSAPMPVGEALTVFAGQHGCDSVEILQREVEQGNGVYRVTRGMMPGVSLEFRAVTDEPH